MWLKRLIQKIIFAKYIDENYETGEIRGAIRRHFPSGVCPRRLW